MRFHIVFLTLTLALGGCAQSVRPAAVSAPIEDFGSIADAPYRIDIPAGWNGRLVMLQHGYEPSGTPRQHPWPQNEAAPIFLSMGYAVAASGYSAQGWAVAEAINDVDGLYRHFVGRHGKPRATYLVGFSMGGHVSLATLEQRGEPYAGVLSVCGINLPAAQVFAEGVVTPLVALDHFFPEALDLPTAGLIDPAAPSMIDPAAIDDMDLKRASVIEEWQKAARRDPTRRYGLHAGPGHSVQIHAGSHFERHDNAKWATVEKYLLGQVINLGGKTPNLHLQLDDGAMLKVTTRHGQVLDQEENLVYRPALLRVRAEEELNSGKLRSAHLIEFVRYQPTFDPAAFNAMVAKGRQAWADAPNVGQWIEEQRGAA